MVMVSIDLCINDSSVNNYLINYIIMYDYMDIKNV